MSALGDRVSRTALHVSFLSMSMSFPIVNTVTPLATVVLAIWAAVVTYRSWRDSREKIRLDLFNRRFDIYVRILALAQALLDWKGTDEQHALVDPFLKAEREAQFIFPSKSGVVEYLQEFHDRALGIVHFKAMMELRAIQERDMLGTELKTERLEDAKWIRNSITRLDELVKPYMGFERL